MNCRLNYLYERFPNNPDFAAHLEKIELEIWNTLKNENFPRFQYEGVNYFALSSKNTKEYKHQMKVLQSLRDKWGSQELFLMKKLPPFDYSLIQVGMGKIEDEQFKIFNSQSSNIKEEIESDFNEEVFNKYQKIKNSANISQEISKEQINQIQELKQSDLRWNKYSNEDIQRFIDSIFPDSKVKNIVWHGSNVKIDNFEIRKEPLVHFGTINAAKQRSSEFDNFVLHPSVLNIKDLKKVEDGMWFGQKVLMYLYENKLISEHDATEISNKSYQEGNNYQGENPSQRNQIIQRAFNNNFTKFLNNNNLGNLGFVYKNFSEDKGNDSYAVFEPEQIYILNSNRAISDMEKFVNNKDNNFEEDVSCFI